MSHLRGCLCLVLLSVPLLAAAQTRKEQIAALQATADSLAAVLEAERVRTSNVEAERLRWQERYRQLQLTLETREAELERSRIAAQSAEARLDSVNALLTRACQVTEAEMADLLSFFRDTTFNEVCFPGMHVQDRSPWDEDAATLPGRLNACAIASAHRMSIACANMSVNSSDDVPFNPIGVYSFRISDDQLGLVVQVFGELASFDTHLWVLDRTQRRIIADVLLQSSSGDAGYSINAGACLFVDNEALFNVMYRSFSSYLEPGIEPDGTEDTQPEEKTNWALMRINANGVDTVTTDGERIRQLQPRLHHQLAKAIGR
jgi:hypothetical protein